MKKILAFVLAMVMVMGMVVVSNAADVIDTELTDENVLYVEVEVDYDEELTAVWVEVDETNEKIDATQGSGSWWYADINDAIEADYTDFEIYATIDGEDVKIDAYEYEAPEVLAVQWILAERIYDAYERHNTTAVIYTYELIDKTITEMDWLWLQNAYAAADWTAIYPNGTYSDGDWDWTDEVRYWFFLNMSLIIVDYDANGTLAEYRIAAADIDNFKAADVDFEIRTTAPSYTVLGTTYTASEVYAKIRELTGDTKNPFVFGWDSEDATPEMTVSIVIPQQWINVYGHKDLTLFVFDMAKVDTECDVCKAITSTMEYGASDDTTVTANTQTQRIVFSTSKLYKTMVLSANALAAEEDAAAAEDANPNTGANDMVNVAVVFSVVALVAAAAFVASKQH